MKRWSVIVAAALMVIGCGGNDEPVSEPETSERESASPSGAGVKAIEGFTGARTKVVWVQQQKDGGLDQHAAGKSHKLMALDTAADGGRERVLLPKVGSYARPLFTPDGERVVFSTKGANKDARGVRSYRPKCFVVGFDGSGLRELGEGYAEDVWQDPADAALWVYVGVEFKDADTVVMEAERLERFRLDAPEKREVVWERTPVGNEGFFVSRDGQRLVGLFPWPNAGLADLASGELTRLGNGCWTSMAPDGSGATWVFDGAHRNATFYGPGGGEIGTLAMNAHADLKGRKVYHPRWSNHARFAVMTGPYLENKKKGANAVEVYLAKFASDLSAIENTVKLTANQRADLFPDVWIEGGEGAALKLASATGATNPGEETEWPSLKKGLLWAWRNTREDVEVDGAVCRVRAQGAARYGRRFDMAPGWGSFVAEGLEEERFPFGSSFAIEAVVTPSEQDGPILQIGARVLSQRDGAFVFSGREAMRFGELKSGQAVDLWILDSGAGVRVMIDGQPQETQAVEGSGLAEVDGVRFGGGGWDGRLERVAVYRDPDLLAFAEAEFPKMAPAPDPVEGRLSVTATLIEQTELPQPEELGAYTRAMTTLLYEVDAATATLIGAPRMAVAHWALMDRKPVAGLPLKIGDELMLVIDPWAEHPQLKSERLFNNISDFDAPLYFDPRTPKLKTNE